MTAALGHIGGPKWPPSPLGGEGLANTFYRLPPSGGKLLSEAKLMRGLTIEPRAAEDIRPYTENVHDPRRGRRPRRPAGPSNTPRRGRSMCASRAAEDIRPYNTHNIRSSYAVGRDDPARRRRKNAPSSVIAYGDATFPPGWGRLYGGMSAQPPRNPFEAQRQRSRWRLCRFTDAVCPLRVGGFKWERMSSGANEFSPPRRK